jgi:hypothetical protein
MAEAKMTDKEIINWILACRDEAEEAKESRMARNKANYDMFHLRHDFSHKEEGQSQEILSKQSMAVEQNKSFFQQALADIGDWWKADAAYADLEESMIIKPHEITKLTNYMLEQALYFSHVGNSIESAMLASLVISKTYGCLKPKPRFVSRRSGRGKGLRRWVEKVEDKTWEIRFSIVRAENYYPDPTGKGLYEIEDSFPDFHEVKAMAEYDEDFDSALIDSLPRAGVPDADEETGKARETGQDEVISGHRPKVELTEFWGTILNKEGEIVYENVQAIVANDSHLILRPRPNPLWHQRTPYTVSPLMEVANSVWHKAPMDAPTMHNHALTEMYNLMVDAAMRQVHAVSQIRKDWLDNPAQVSDGIPAGSALVVNSMCPPGAKVMEPLTAVQIPADAFNIFNLMGQEFNASALTNDLRSGVMPSREMKATAIVEQSQTITGVFQGMAKNYEARQSQKELELAWMTTAQNWDQIDKEIFISLFGRERGEEMAQMSPQDVFANTVNGLKFRVFGVTLTMAKAQDFQKLMTLLQTLGGSPVLMEEFVKKYDLGKALGEIMTSLNIDKHKLEIPRAAQMTMEAPVEGVPGAEPDMMSQVAGPPAGSLKEMLGAALPQSEFPGSPATAGGGV